MYDFVNAVELAAAGITVACTGAMLAVLYIVFSPALDKEIRDDSPRRPL